MRYELRRVWVLEANLKDSYRHLYPTRHMYVDEDSWLMVMADNYDARGGLWRTSMINYFYAYEANTWQAVSRSVPRSAGQELSGLQTWSTSSPTAIPSTRVT